jgi:hypothetical protein
MNEAEKIKDIKTKDDFVSFVYSLSQDYQNNPSSWKNNEIGTFLEAMAAWVDDMEGYYLNQCLPVPEKPDWKMIANMVAAAKIYE